MSRHKCTVVRGAGGAVLTNPGAQTRLVLPEAGLLSGCGHQSAHGEERKPSYSLWPGAELSPAVATSGMPPVEITRLAPGAGPPVDQVKAFVSQRQG